MKKLLILIYLVFLCVAAFGQGTLNDPALSVETVNPYTLNSYAPLTPPVKSSAPSNGVAFQVINTGTVPVFVSKTNDGNRSNALSTVQPGQSDAEYFTGSALYLWSDGAGSCTLTFYSHQVAPVLASLGPYFAGLQGHPYTDIYAGLPGGYGRNFFGQGGQPVVYNPQSAVFFVSNSTANGMSAGSDSNSGSFTSPFATIYGALNSLRVSNPGGDFKILVNDGVYPEDSAGVHFLQVKGLFSQYISIEPLSPRIGAVTVTSNSASTHGVIYVSSSNHVANIQFKGLTILSDPTALGPLIWLNSTDGQENGLHFVSCQLIQRLSSSTQYIFQSSTDGATNDVVFIGCSFQTTGTGTASPWIYNIYSSVVSWSMTNFGWYGCSTGAGANFQDSGILYGVNGVSIIGNDISIAGGHGWVLGSDTDTSTISQQQKNVYIAGNHFNAPGSIGHGLLIGAGTIGALVENNDISGGLHGLSVKLSSNCLARSNRIVMSSGFASDALISKASSGTTFVGNMCYISSGTAFREYNDAQSPQQPALDGDCMVVGNYFVADGSSTSLVSWSDLTGSTGSCRSDWNVYELRNSASWGTFRGNSISSLAGLQAAWVNNGLVGDVATSDQHSIVNAGQRNDISYTGSANQTYYVRIVSGSGRFFNGQDLEAYDPSKQWRGAMYLMPTVSGGSTYARPTPVNLPVGSYTVLVYQRMGEIPSSGDPIVSQQPLSYAS